MRWKKWLTVGVIVAAPGLHSTAALATGDGKVQAASGTVVAVTEGSRTIVMQSTPSTLQMSRRFSIALRVSIHSAHTVAPPRCAV